MENTNDKGRLSSKIIDITVYADRAMIVREANTSLSKGEHKLLFDDLPESIEQNSIQVTGKGSAILSDIKFKREHFEETPHENIKAINDKIIEIQDSLRIIGDKSRQSDNERILIQNIANKLTATPEKTDRSELDPDRWIKLVAYYRDRQDSLDKEIQENEKSIRILNKQLSKLQKEKNDMGSHQSKIKNQVEVSVEMKKDDDLSLSLSYIVYGPSWHPVYDLRVSTENKKMNLCYNAMIVQNTTEDWDDVKISLSTAQPQISGQQPELSPWHINFYRPVYASDSKKLSRRRGKADEAPQALSKQMFQSEMAGSALDEELPDEAPAPAMEMPEAAVETRATSVVFVVSGRNTVKSDNLKHKVTVMLHEFPAHFRYSTVPKLNPYAYLKAKVKNTTEFPFLPGETNVFLDNNFVANSHLDIVSPSEEFWTFLGVDEGMKVEHKFIKKYHKTEGMLSKKNVIIYEYLIKITNNKKTSEELVVWDRSPYQGIRI